MIRVGFTKIGGDSWKGGHNYLVNLLRALVVHQSSVITPVLFVDPSVIDADLSEFTAIHGVEIVRSDAFSEKRNNVALLHGILFGGDRRINLALRNNRIDVFLEAARFIGWRPCVSVIAWIPDLQHRDLPGYFGLFARSKRELGFRTQFGSNRTIMVSSHDAKASCEVFYRKRERQVEVVSFAVPFPSLDNGFQSTDVTKRYQLPQSFFYMPNHFWKHKNHEIVVDALATLRERGVEDIVVVASGNPIDPRNPTFFRKLENRIRHHNIEKQFRILGMIPYPDVVALLRSSRGLLNPSLYEGWSTTVEEARSLGVPMMLSDIAVHKEQAPTGTRFFDRHSASSLANELLLFSAVNRKSETDLRNAALGRVRDFALRFAEVVKSSMTRRHGI